MYIIEIRGDSVNKKVLIFLTIILASLVFASCKTERKTAVLDKKKYEITLGEDNRKIKAERDAALYEYDSLSTIKKNQLFEYDDILMDMVNRGLITEEAAVERKEQFGDKLEDIKFGRFQLEKIYAFENGKHYFMRPVIYLGIKFVGNRGVKNIVYADSPYINSDDDVTINGRAYYSIEDNGRRINYTVVGDIVNYKNINYIDNKPTFLDGERSNIIFYEAVFTGQYKKLGEVQNPTSYFMGQ